MEFFLLRIFDNFYFYAFILLIGFVKNIILIFYKLYQNEAVFKILFLELQRRRIIPRNIKKFLSVPACTHWINGPTRKTRSWI